MLAREDFIKEKSDDFSSGGSISSFGNIQVDRVPMIEKVFKEVLGRKPSSRELAYYKYGVIKEDGIRSKLIKSQEHKDLIDSALKLPGVENELKSVRVSEKKLGQKVEDIRLEIVESEKLLNEKNFLIKELREKVSNPYDFPSKIEKYEEGFDVYSSRERTGVTIEKKKSFKDVIKDIFEILFK